MLISDWSSDVCASDLAQWLNGPYKGRWKIRLHCSERGCVAPPPRMANWYTLDDPPLAPMARDFAGNTHNDGDRRNTTTVAGMVGPGQIGRATGRERVCQKM